MPIREGAKGEEHRQHANAVFLCAGAVETPRLLLHAELGNASGEVGKNFMAHVATQVWGSFDESVRMNKGFPATVISEDLLRPTNAHFAGGAIVQSLGVVPVTWGQGVARGRGYFGEPLVRYLDGYNKAAGIGINGECLPAHGNYLELSDERDMHGLPKAVNGSVGWTTSELPEAGLMRQSRSGGESRLGTHHQTAVPLRPMIATERPSPTAA